MTAENQPKRIGAIKNEKKVRGEKISCEEKRRGSLCVGCGGAIQDQYILRVAPDLEWHASCLKCADCNQYLDETCTCFVRDGKTYCKRDYVRLFGTKCAKCQAGFCKSDFVMRARNKIFHIDCFRCVACSRQLIPGDEFALRDDGLFCKADHEVVERAHTGQNGNSSENNNNNINTHNNNNNDSKSDPKSSPIHTSETPMRGGRHGGHKTDHKPTRVRTVLNEKQLHTLRTCYAANPRPDALMKEQLTEMTGLSQRVIRVWFQNKRCKDKKRSILMKQIQAQNEKDGCMDWEVSDDGVVYARYKNGTLSRPLQGVPMVASSPVRHESNLQPNQVEVQSYTAPWKALSEFALHNDLDQAPFQQLVDSDGYEDEAHFRLISSAFSRQMDGFDHSDSQLGMLGQSDSIMSAGGGNGGLGGCGTPPTSASYMGGSTGDELLSQPPNSVSSDFPQTPSELSSPMSQ